MISNNLCRIWIAALGAVSVFTAKFFLVFAYAGEIPSIGELILLVEEYFFTYLPQNLSDERVWVIVSVIAAVAGLFTGPALSRLQQKFGSR